MSEIRNAAISDHLYNKAAFRRIYAGLTMYSWDRFFVERAVDLAMELSSSVPCYELACLPDVSAVECLEGRLKEDMT